MLKYSSKNENTLGNLYLYNSKIENSEQPIIYIGGQMERYSKIFEKNNFIPDRNGRFTGYFAYDFLNVYPDKKSIKALNFSKDLVDTLKQAGLSNAILVAQGYGGLIASYASQSDLIKKVICIHSPVIGTPLSRPEYMEYYREILTEDQKLILDHLKKVIDFNYGFQKDLFDGFDFYEADMSKVVVVGNHLDSSKEQNGILRDTHDIIKKITGLENDGVIIFDPYEFDRKRINYVKTEGNVNHFESNSSAYIEDSLKRVLKR